MSIPCVPPVLLTLVRAGLNPPVMVVTPTPLCLGPYCFWDHYFLRRKKKLNPSPWFPCREYYITNLSGSYDVDSLSLSRSSLKFGLEAHALMPADFHSSFQELNEASANSLNHNRKRKCQGEQQEWLTSKHTCFALASTSTSEPDSIIDSNSLPTQSDSIASSYVQTKSDPDQSSNNYAYGYGHVMMDEYDSYESAAAHGQQIEDHLLEFAIHGNHSMPECDIDTMELGEEEDKDLEGLLHSDCSKVNPNMFVLSSGRWVVKQDDDGRPAARKPTIDQEFEQYFSTLML